MFFTPRSLDLNILTLFVTYFTKNDTAPEYSGFVFKKNIKIAQ